MAERRARGIHADKDFGDSLDVEVLGQLDDAKVVVDDFPEALKHFADGFAVGFGITRRVIVDQFDQVRIGRKDFSHIGDPCCVLCDGRVADLEALFLWVESDFDANGLVILGENLAAKQACHESCNALLAIDEDALAGRERSILELHRGIAPCDEIADGVALVERVE